VGKKSGTSEERIKKFSASAGVPANYYVAFQKKVGDCKAVPLLGMVETPPLGGEGRLGEIAEEIGSALQNSKAGVV
jgi:hypothetical protein